MLEKVFLVSGHVELEIGRAPGTVLPVINQQTPNKESVTLRNSTATTAGPIAGGPVEKKPYSSRECLTVTPLAVRRVNRVKKPDDHTFIINIYFLRKLKILDN